MAWLVSNYKVLEGTLLAYQIKMSKHAMCGTKRWKSSGRYQSGMVWYVSLVGQICHCTPSAESSGYKKKIKLPPNKKAHT